MRSQSVSKFNLGEAMSTPQHATEEGKLALDHMTNILEFVSWFDPMEPGEGIHKFAEELGIPINELKDNIVKTLRKRIAERKGRTAKQWQRRTLS